MITFEIFDKRPFHYKSQNRRQVKNEYFSFFILVCFIFLKFILLIMSVLSDFNRRKRVFENEKKHNNLIIKKSMFFYPKA